MLITLTCLHSVDYEPGNILSDLHILSSLIPMIMYYYYHPCFSDEGTRQERDKKLPKVKKLLSEGVGNEMSSDSSPG